MPDSIKSHITEVPRPAPVPLTTAAVKPAVPTPTSDQRLAIRNMLDKHFDDQTGRFLDGMSDRSIAEKLNLPAIVVKTIREAAYGPEREDPEIGSIREEIARLDKSANEIKGAIALLAKRLDKFGGV